MPLLPRPRFLISPSTFDAVSRILRSQYVGLPQPSPDLPVTVKPLPKVEPESIGVSSSSEVPTVLETPTPEPAKEVVVPEPNTPVKTEPFAEPPVGEDANVANVEPVNPIGSEDPPPATDVGSPVDSKPEVLWDPDMKKADLLSFAMSHGIDVAVTATKAEIVAAIRTAGF